MPISKSQLRNDQAEVMSSLGSDPATGPGKGAFYPKTISGVVEAVYKDDQGRIIQLTSNGSPTGGGGGGGSVSDIAYDSSTWDGVASTAPSKNAVRDKFVSLDAAIAAIVSAAGSIATHSDVDLTGNAVGKVLAWNGTNFVPTSVGGTGDLLSTNNLSDVANAATALTNLGGLAASNIVSQAEAEAGTATTARVWTAQRVAQAIAALAPGGGGSVSDVAYDQTTWDGVTGVAPSKNVVRDKFVSVDAAVAGKLANTLVSQALMEAGTDNNAVAMSPLRVAQAIAALAPGGGSSNEYRFKLPAAASIAARIPLQVGLPGGWSLATADTAGEGQFSTNADTLIITWDSGLGTKIAEISVFQETTGGPASTQGIAQLDTWAASLVKTKTDQTKAAVYLNGLGVSTSKDLYVMVRLV